jgi:NADPH:quinone reductase-like Zn-dependent oxidoreductase
MWRAVRDAGLTRQNAAAKNILVHGAAGGLGTLALQMLSAWGARATAIARSSSFAACREAGAAEVVDRTSKPFASLSRSFDATLNFATWDDELALLGCLREGGLGHATTVHPMLRIRRTRVARRRREDILGQEAPSRRVAEGLQKLCLDHIPA